MVLTSVGDLCLPCELCLKAVFKNLSLEIVLIHGKSCLILRKLFVFSYHKAEVNVFSCRHCL